MNRLILILIGVPLIQGCYHSSLEGEDRQDSREDAMPEEAPDDEDADPDDDDSPDMQDDGDGLDPDSGEPVIDHDSQDSWWDNWIDADPACPPPSDIEVAFIVDGVVEPDAPIVLETPCTISSVDMPLPTVINLALDCGTGGIITSHMIEIQTFPPLRIEIPPGTEVMFHYVVAISSEAPPWTSRWFTLTDMEGSLLISGTDADAGFPPDTDHEAWYSPILVFPHEEGYFWGSLECYDYDRLSISFEYYEPANSRAEVWDHGEGWLGPPSPTR